MSELSISIYNLICDYLDSAEWEKIGGERVWDIDKVAERTGYSKKYLYNQISSGKITPYKINNSIYIRYSDIKNLFIKRTNVEVNHFTNCEMVS
jgi:hypothetical protein